MGKVDESVGWHVLEEDAEVGLEVVSELDELLKKVQLPWTTVDLH